MELMLINDTIGQVAVVAFPVRVDASNARAMRDHLEKCLKLTNRLVLNLVNLEFIDSSGLGVMVGSLRKALEAGGDVRLAGMGPKVKMVFDLTQAQKLFRTFADVDRALASYDGQAS